MRVLWIVAISLGVATSCDTPSGPQAVDGWEPVALEAVPYSALGGGRLGFARLDPEGGGGYYLIDVAAETSHVYPGYGTSQALSPDGASLAASSQALDYREVWNIYAGALADTVFRELRGPSGENDFDDSPVWTADGDSIVYSVRLWPEGGAELRRRAVAGGDITTITSIPAGEIYSRASITHTPWLVAMSRPGAAGIFTVGSATAPQLLISQTDVPSSEEHSHDLEAPAWSPDGTVIAFISHDWRASGIGTELYLYEPATGSLRLLATVASNSVVEWGAERDQRSVAWSPDGSRIAFTAYDDELQSHVFVIHPDGSGLTQVTTRPGIADFSVTWVP